MKVIQIQILFDRNKVGFLLAELEAKVVLHTIITDTLAYIRECIPLMIKPLIDGILINLGWSGIHR